MRRSLGAVLVIAIVLGGIAYREGLIPPSSTGATDAGARASRGASHAARPAVTVMMAVSGDLPVRRSTIGWITSTASTAVTTQQQGMVTRIAQANGAEVKAGDLLVQLDDRAVQARLARDRAGLARDQATVVSTAADLKRARDLVVRQVDSSQQLDQVVAAAASAAAVVSLDQANIVADQVVVDDMRITAPHDGRLGAFAVTVGSLVQPGTAVVVLTDMEHVEANFAVSDADVGLLRQTLASGKVTVRVAPSNQPTRAETAEPSEGPAAGGADAAGERSAAATVDFIDSMIATNSGTMAVRAAVPNGARRFWPGQAVKVDVDLGLRRNVAIVPTVAVQPGQSGSNVFVVKPDGTIDVRPVDVAGIVGDRAGIAFGLEAGEKVVTEGQLALASGMKVAIRQTVAVPAASGKGGAGAPADRSEARL